MIKQCLLRAAVFKAVRTPSRLDVGYFTPNYPLPPPAASVAVGPDFISEKVNPYEGGYRVQPTSGSTFSLSGFYHKYKDLYSVEALPGTLSYQIPNASEGAWTGSNERVMGHPIIVERYKNVKDIKDCHILYINLPLLPKDVLTTINERGTLTVSDTPDFARHGGIIRFATKKNKIKRQINPSVARAATLNISSKLLRVSYIIK